MGFNNIQFENNYIVIYPNELELKKKNKDSYKVSFLNLSIEVLNRICLIKDTSSAVVLVAFSI